MIRLFREHRGDRERTVQAYADAERRGKVSRASNKYDLSAEDYARALLADGLRKGGCGYRPVKSVTTCLVFNPGAVGGVAEAVSGGWAEERIVERECCEGAVACRTRTRVAIRDTRPLKVVARSRP
jgi:hypothetical protein